MSEIGREAEEIAELGPMEAFAWILAGALLLDVREEPEADEASIPGGLLIGERELRELWEELPRDRAIVAYCRRGNRSYDACGFLESKGFSRLANLEGGVIAWEKAGLPLEGARFKRPLEPEVAEWATGMEAMRMGLGMGFEAEPRMA